MQIKKTNNLLEIKNYIQIISKFEKELFDINGYTEDELISMFSNNSFYLYFLKMNDEICGYAIVYKTVEFAEIYKIAIIRKLQKFGYGSNLLNEIKNDNNKILIEVSDRDKTYEFYLKNNFRLLNKRHRYYYDGSNAYIMEYCKNN